MPLIEESAPADAAKLSPSKAAVVIVGLVVVVAGYLILGNLFGIAPVYAGILLVYFTFAIGRGEPGALPGAILGSLGGIVNAALFAIPSIDPGISALIGLIVVLIALFCLLTGWLPLIFNQAYMLLLTVGTIPAILAQKQFAGMAAAVLLAAVYFGALIWMLHRLRARSAGGSSGN